MKLLRLLVLLLASFSADSFADAGYARLFKSTGSSLLEQDKKKIYSLLGLTAGSGLGHVLEGCPSAGFKVKLIDLNGDGTAEVFVTGGNTCTSGVTGSSVWLFIKSTGSAYQMQFGFPAAAYEILQGSFGGYPDIRFGATGFCQSVWRWNGKRYFHLKNDSTSSGGCDGR